MKKKRSASKTSESARKLPRQAGNVSQAAGRTLTSYDVGALPILNHFLERADLKKILRRFVVEDKRCTISPVVGTLILVKNYLVSREPIYGVGHWASQYRPDLLGLSAKQVSSLNDDRVGRSLDRLFDADCPALVLEITRHVAEEFGVDLSELHNDSTTITFSGNYEAATDEARARGKPTPAVTWGFNKDHRPDLKQLLYNLTVSSDGAVPVTFGVENGNVTDDQTHRANWELLCQIIGSVEFIYVADSKLATHANMTHIANRGGRFISVLPRTRSEDKKFRQKLLEGHDQSPAVRWREIHRKYDDDGNVIDVISSAKEESSTSEGFRLLWFHSTRKLELDRQARAKHISRAGHELAALSLKLRSARTRYREESQVRKAVEKRLSDAGATEWMRVDIVPENRPVFVQETPGRPGPNTRYRKEARERFNISYDVDHEKVSLAEKQDGVFPLVTNDRRLSAKEVLLTYKRQAQIETRFSQLKTQFEIAPVFLKSVHRVVALLTVYYLALLIQALVERELRLGMRREKIDSLPLYHEERKCRAPTTRRLIDLFENVQFHELQNRNPSAPVRFATELTELQREVLRILRIPAGEYDAG